MRRLPLPAISIRHLGGALLAGAAASAAVAVLARNVVTREILIALSWDAGAILFGALMLLATGRWDEQQMAEKVGHRSPGSGLFAVLATSAAVFGIYAVILLMGAAGSAPGKTVTEHVVVGAVTTAVSWCLVHLLFGLEYARIYYTKPLAEQGGLAFPGDRAPNYVDFFYFSFVIGVACQTADVSTTSRAMRKVALAHGIVAFIFNTVILAGAINIGAGLLSRS